jgi:hypothetical protein
MKTTILVAFGIFSLAVSLAVLRAAAQSVPLKPDNNQLTQTGLYLLHESDDFRRNIFDAVKLESQIRRGVVSCLQTDFYASGRVEEHSTNDWSNVASALRSLGMLERLRQKPQIRVVQRDSILQSTIIPFLGPQSGCEKGFLERELRAGDIIIITLRSE